MLTVLKSKIALAIIGIVGVGTITATAAVASAQHAGPFAVNTTQQGSSNTDSTDPTKTAKANGQDQEFHAQGLIVSVTFAAGSTNSGTLVLRPNGQQTTVTVRFTADTHVEVALSHDKTTSSNDKGKGTPTPAKTPSKGAAALTANLYASVEGTKQSDGTILAKEIQANDNGNAHHGGDEGTPEPSDDHATPHPDDGHGTPSPHSTPEPDEGHGTPQPSH